MDCEPALSSLAHGMALTLFTGPYNLSCELMCFLLFCELIYYIGCFIMDCCEPAVFIAHDIDLTLDLSCVLMQ